MGKKKLMSAQMNSITVLQYRGLQNHQKRIEVMYLMTSSDILILICLGTGIHLTRADPDLGITAGVEILKSHFMSTKLRITTTYVDHYAMFDHKLASTTEQSVKYFISNYFVIELPIQ